MHCAFNWNPHPRRHGFQKVFRMSSTPDSAICGATAPNALLVLAECSSCRAIFVMEQPRSSDRTIANHHRFAWFCNHVCYVSCKVFSDMALATPSAKRALTSSRSLSNAPNRISIGSKLDLMISIDQNHGKTSYLLPPVDSTRSSGPTRTTVPHSMQSIGHDLQIFSNSPEDPKMELL